ncbi:MAG TPA: hypothetical protein VD978_08350 [Azospirillum sp.]|nr:hypothetical protein [Azospirillum sp.]
MTSKVLQTAAKAIPAASKAVYDDLMAKTRHESGRASLSRVWAACDHLEQQHQLITLAAVAKYVEAQHGGPKEQSIRNAKDTLRRIIELRRNEQTLAVPQNRRAADEVVSDDPNVQAYVNVLKGHIQSLQEENARLKKGFGTLAPRSLLELSRIVGTDSDNQPELQATNQLDDRGSVQPSMTAEERNSLARFLDAQHLYDHGFEVRNNQVETASGLIFIEPLAFAVLRRLVETT